MGRIEELKDVNNIELDVDTNDLFIEKEKGDGVKVRVTDQEKKFLLDTYTDKDYELEELLDG